MSGNGSNHTSSASLQVWSVTTQKLGSGRYRTGCFEEKIDSIAVKCDGGISFDEMATVSWFHEPYKIDEDFTPVTDEEENTLNERVIIEEYDENDPDAVKLQD